MNILLLVAMTLVGFGLGAAVALKVWTLRFRSKICKGTTGHFYDPDGKRHAGVVIRVFQNGHISVFTFDTNEIYRLNSKKQFHL